MVGCLPTTAWVLGAQQQSENSSVGIQCALSLGSDDALLAAGREEARESPRPTDWESTRDSHGVVDEPATNSPLVPAGGPPASGEFVAGGTVPGTFPAGGTPDEKYAWWTPWLQEKRYPSNHWGGPSGELDEDGRLVDRAPQQDHEPHGVVRRGRGQAGGGQRIEEQERFAWSSSANRSGCVDENGAPCGRGRRSVDETRVLPPWGASLIDRMNQKKVVAPSSARVVPRRASVGVPSGDLRGGAPRRPGESSTAVRPSSSPPISAPAGGDPLRTHRVVEEHKSPVVSASPSLVVVPSAPSSPHSVHGFEEMSLGPDNGRIGPGFPRSRLSVGTSESLKSKHHNIFGADGSEKHSEKLQGPICEFSRRDPPPSDPAKDEPMAEDPDGRSHAFAFARSRSGAHVDAAPG